MRIIIKKGGVEVPMDSSRYPFVDLYAPDRADIPAGLVEDDATNRRLGVWSGTIATSYANPASLRDFDEADVTIRYDQWRLGELKDAHGDYPRDLAICLYRHDGTGWKRVHGYSAGEAQANNYRIGGTLKSVSGAQNLGWFAVVAKCNNGTVVVVR